jgi:hypothetical protein
MSDVHHRDRRVRVLRSQSYRQRMALIGSNPQGAPFFRNCEALLFVVVRDPSNII